MRRVIELPVGTDLRRGITLSRNVIFPQEDDVFVLNIETMVQFSKLLIYEGRDWWGVLCVVTAL